MEDLECMVCLEDAKDARLCPICAKIFCRGCISKCPTGVTGTTPCPQCRAEHRVESYVSLRFVENLREEFARKDKEVENLRKELSKKDEAAKSAIFKLEKEVKELKGQLQRAQSQVQRRDNFQTTNSAHGSGGEAAASTSSAASTGASSPIVKEHATWSVMATTKALALNTQVLIRHGPLQCLIAAANSELQRLHDQAEQVKKAQRRNPLFLLKYDPRLSHILVYLICNDAPKVAVVERILIEQFTEPVIADDALSLQFHNLVAKKLEDIRNSISEDEIDYWKWHQDYKTFRKMISNFSHAVDLFYKGSYQEALMYFVTIGDTNNSLVHSRETELRGLNVALLHHFRRRSVLLLNAKAVANFVSGDPSQYDECIRIMGDWIIPCSMLLSLCCDDLDSHALDSIRKQWSDLPRTPPFGPRLQGLVSQLLYPPEQVVLKRAPSQWRIGVHHEELQEDWLRTYNLIAQHKELNEVNKAEHLRSSGGGGVSGVSSGSGSGD